MGSCSSSYWPVLSVAHRNTGRLSGIAAMFAGGAVTKSRGVATSVCTIVFLSSSSLMISCSFALPSLRGFGPLPRFLLYPPVSFGDRSQWSETDSS